MKNIKRWILFVVIVAPIVYLLTFGLMRNARELPSVLIGKKAPTFQLQTLDGKTIALESFLGKPLVINFWATWCPPCLIEQPSFSAAKKVYEKDGVQFIGVVYQSSKKEVEDFTKEYGEHFIVAFDPDSKMAIDYGVGGVPETFFVDGEGIIRKRFEGAMSQERIVSILDKLLKK